MPISYLDAQDQPNKIAICFDELKKILLVLKTMIMYVTVFSSTTLNDVVYYPKLLPVYKRCPYLLIALKESLKICISFPQYSWNILVICYLKVSYSPNIQKKTVSGCKNNAVIEGKIGKNAKYKT